LRSGEHRHTKLFPESEVVALAGDGRAPSRRPLPTILLVRAHDLARLIAS
jgi:hypothetical protein